MENTALNTINSQCFAIQKSRVHYKEEMAILQYAIINKIPYKFCKKKENVPINYIPVGSVEWCSNFLDSSNITPNYYPEFLNKYLHRKIWRTNKWPSENVFIKPADRYKRFAGFVINKDNKKKRGPFWCSEVVDFVNEWRYYIASGEIIAAEWYKGDESEPDPPELDITFDSNYCAALDFGELSTGEIALIEAQLPFACGWYGKDYKIYAKWIIVGWNYIKNM
jgi:hypothetical protein